jgi:hypothetical protein
VLACLAKKPEDRPCSAADLSRRSRRIEGEPWSDEQAMEWWRINRPTQARPAEVRIRSLVNAEFESDEIAMILEMRDSDGELVMDHSMEVSVVGGSQ